MSMGVNWNTNNLFVGQEEVVSAPAEYWLIGTTPGIGLGEGPDEMRLGIG